MLYDERRCYRCYGRAPRRAQYNHAMHKAGA